MILTDTKIMESIRDGSIVIEPFDELNLGANSYDVHLGGELAVYRDEILDSKKHNEVDRFQIDPVEGFILWPGRTYLGVTKEYTETHTTVPFLEGKSSVGRLGIDIHATAGKGDVGFCNHWTLEISVHQPVRVYVGMPIAQIIYFEISGSVETLYKDKKSAKYTKRSTHPVESMMWMNSF
jgi:dCTP deaminase